MTAFVTTDRALSVTVDVVDARGVGVHLVGELDIQTATVLTAALAPLCREGPDAVPVLAGGTVVLDLSGLSFMDSAGLASLADNRMELIARGWRVCPSLPQGHVRRLLAFAVREGLLPSDFVCPDVPIWSRLDLAPVDVAGGAP